MSLNHKEFKNFSPRENELLGVIAKLSERLDNFEMKMRNPEKLEEEHYQRTESAILEAASNIKISRVKQVLQRVIKEKDINLMCFSDIARDQGISLTKKKDITYLYQQIDDKESMIKKLRRQLKQAPAAKPKAFLSEEDLKSDETEDTKSDTVPDSPM